MPIDLLRDPAQAPVAGCGQVPLPDQTVWKPSTARADKKGSLQKAII
jgi:hypothetical protein